ncbi:MAG TPA: quinol dehydrogenase ferredoxin subunit NapH [Bacteroidetes bacterium]|nr:putative electron transport protein YccM [bacterium BMS3Bbin04]HDO66341.1 quinol dehydrogenase ferredoxin subunit NapH [Bacteroidota bacterium]HEX05466.1 quinol dehydrogenase ferredoxin subunit NapH [Bacteroidota bacterium]
MSKSLSSYRYLLLRRLTQTVILVLFVLASSKVVNVLNGDFSFALFLDKLPLADPYAVLQMFFAGAKITIDVLIGAGIVFFFYALLAGRVFCSWVCPVNMVTDLAGFLRRKWKIGESGGSRNWPRSIRYWAFALGLILSLVFGMTAFEMISPIGIFHRGIIYGMELGWFVIVGLFLFDLLVLKNGFCGHICPLGGFYSATTRFSLLRVRHIKDACTLCMLCKDVCPEKQVLHLVGKKDGIVESGECTNCGRCVEVCDDDSLKFGIRSSKKFK